MPTGCITQRAQGGRGRKGNLSFCDATSGAHAGIGGEVGAQKDVFN